MDSPSKETTKAEKKASTYILGTAFVMLGIFAFIGWLDQHGYLDPILDFMGIPK